MSKRTAASGWGKFLLFSCLTLVVTTGGVFGIGRQWLREASEVSGSQPVGQVLAATDEQPEGLPDALIFRIKTEFLDLMQAQQVQVGERLVVDGETVLNGGLTVEGGAAFAGDIAFDAITVSGDISITDGDITAEGSNIDLGDGTITASNIVYEVLAGDGISIDGTQTVTVTNDDRGSAQKIFGKVKVGDVTLTADSNTDTLTLSAGSGVGLSTGSSNTVTISADNLSGWYKPSSTIVSLITSTNNVGIGTSAPTNKLEIDSGSSNVSGLTFTRLDSSSPSGVGGGKVLSLDSGGRVILVTDQTGDTPTAESVLPDAENGGTLYFNGTNWVSSTNLFHNGGSVGISTTSPAGRFHTYTNAIGTIGAVIQGYSGQTANLQEWRNGAGSILSYIDADGVFNGSANVAGSIDPGLTQGQIAFQGADGLAGSNNLFWNNATGNLGIGTSSPTQKLEIAGSLLLQDNNKIQFGATGSELLTIRENSLQNNLMTIEATQHNGQTGRPSLGIRFSSAGSFGIGIDDNANLLRVQAGGNVGIGTTSPTQKLDVNGTSRFSSTSAYNGGGSVQAANSSDTTEFVAIGWDNSIGTYGAGYIQSLKSGQTYNNPLLLNPNAGNVGIGTTVPSAPFHSAGASGELNARIGSAIITTIPSSVSTGKGLYAGANNVGMFSWNGAVTLNTGASVAERFRVDADGNVGIGTTTPMGKLHVEGAAIGKALAILNETGDQNIFVASASGTNRFVIQNGGNIGIGTTNPISKLHLNGGVGSLATGLAFGDGNTGMYETSNDVIDYSIGGSLRARLNSGHFRVVVSGVGDPVMLAETATSTNPNIGFYGDEDTGLGRAGADILSLIAGGVNGLNVNSAGNVGIGTTAPANLLSVGSSSQFQVGSDGRITHSGSYLNWAGLTNTMLLGDTGGNWSLAYQKYSEGSKVAIGRNINPTTVGSQISIVPNGASVVGLAVRGAADQTADFIQAQNSGGISLFVVKSDGSVGIGSTTPGQALDVVGNARFSAVGSDAYASDLHLTADGTLTTAASDIRLKKDLVELNDGAVLDKLLQLKTYNFNWKSNNSTDIGMVAQEVATIFPELTFTNQVDGYMGINYSRFSSLLVSAMQAQQTQISSLQNTYKLTNTGILQPINQATEAAQPTEAANPEQPWYTQLAEAVTVMKETIFSKAVRFEALAQFMANTIFTGPAEFLGAARFKDGATIEGELALSANQTGSAEVPAGATRIEVKFSKPLTQTPLVIVTPNGFVTGQYKVADKTTNSFIIELSEPQTKAVKFDWQASVQADSQSQPSVTVLESTAAQVEDETEQPAQEELPAEEQEVEAVPIATQAAAQVAGSATESAEVAE